MNYSLTKKEKIIMKIKAISDIPNAAFYSLKTWAESSSTNLNMLVGIGFILIIIGAILVYFCVKNSIKI